MKMRACMKVRTMMNGILKYNDEWYMRKVNLGLMTAVQKEDTLAELKHWLTNGYEHWLKKQIRERGTVTKEDILKEFEFRGVRVWYLFIQFHFYSCYLTSKGLF